MYANSRPVQSAQTSIHEHLATAVSRHAGSLFRKPVMPYNREAFEYSMAAWNKQGSWPLILDAGCGVGLSTFHLAAKHPNCFVIGVDQSADRLSRNTAWTGPLPDNCIRVRADLVDFWRLMHASGVQLERHYILYPNPWPKIGQLARRWHGHPVFPTVVALGGWLECRSNWRIYVDECAAAIAQLTGRDVQCAPYATDVPMTPFEQKYRDSGHALWHCVAQLSPA